MGRPSQPKQTLQLFLDLGDIFTKGVAVGSGVRRPRLRFPSVVAQRLAQAQGETANLLLDGPERVQRPEGFDPSEFPRTRSYPGAEKVVQKLTKAPPAQGARFAGWLAAVYGSNRQLLGRHPTEENIDALVHKALLLQRPASSCRAEVVFILDAGAKAQAILRYASSSPRVTTVAVRSIRQPRPRRVELTVTGTVLDAGACAVAALPPELAVDRVGRVLVIDIGYLRTKLAILSPDGCEHQELLEDLGVSDCVRRVLRDGQDQGLVEDELAVARALENAADETIEVAGRRFDVRPALESARRSLSEELARASRRALLSHCERSAKMCRAVAVIGGGAALIGASLSERLQALDLGLESLWVTKDASYVLAEGAAKIHGTRVPT